MINTKATAGRFACSGIRISNIFQYILCICMVMGMFLISSLLKESEIIFPETLALCIGAWYVKEFPWRVSKWSLILLMSLSALAGICIVRFLPDMLLLRITVGFILVAALLTISRTTIFPIISACILPIMLHTTSWIYFLSVVIISTIIVAIRYLLEKINVQKKEIVVHTKLSSDSLSHELIIWSKRFIIYLIIAIIAIQFHVVYIITPPLIVVFTELSKENSKLKKRPLSLIALFTIAAVIGTFMRLICIEQLHIPSFLCAGLGTLLLLIVMQLLKMFVPPAGACMLLAFLLPGPLPYTYPVFICIGTSLFTIAAILIFHDQTISEQHNMQEDYLQS